MNVISFSPESPALLHSERSRNDSSRNIESNGNRGYNKDKNERGGAQGNIDVDDLLFSDMRNQEKSYDYGKEKGNEREKGKEKESGRDIYLRGIQNLGLGDSFGTLEGLGLDLSIEAMRESFSNNDISNNNSYGNGNSKGGNYSNIPVNTKHSNEIKRTGRNDNSQHNIYGTVKRGGVGSGSSSGTIGQRERGRGGIDLESLEYYNTGVGLRSAAHVQ